MIRTLRTLLKNFSYFSLFFSRYLSSYCIYNWLLSMIWDKNPNYISLFGKLFFNSIYWIISSLPHPYCCHITSLIYQISICISGLSILFLWSICLFWNQYTWLLWLCNISHYLVEQFLLYLFSTFIHLFSVSDPYRLYHQTEKRVFLSSGFWLHLINNEPHNRPE